LYFHRFVINAIIIIVNAKGIANIAQITLPINLTNTSNFDKIFDVISLVFII